MYCLRCKKELEKRQTKYCSQRCSKLYLKAGYRQRHKEQIQKYNREWKKLGISGSPSDNGYLRGHRNRNPQCAKCGSIKNVHVCHVKPRAMGGKNTDNLITLCQTHHHQFDELLRSFWQGDITVETRPRVTMIVEVV